MRGFVTGATGFLGSHLVRALVAPTAADALDDLRGAFEAIRRLGAALSGDGLYHKRVTVEGTRTLMGFAAECGLARVGVEYAVPVEFMRTICPAENDACTAAPPRRPACGPSEQWDEPRTAGTHFG